MGKVQDFEVFQGETFEETITYTDENGAPIDLTGSTAVFEIQNEPAGIMLYSITENAGITLRSTSGQIALQIPASVTATWPGDFAGVHRLRWRSVAGVVDYLIAGNFLVKKD